MVERLLCAGADPSARTRSGETARDLAATLRRPKLGHVIDAHLTRQLRALLVNICFSFRAADLPVLVLLECFAASAAMTYAGEVVSLPLDLQWRIAKRTRE